MEEHVTSIGAAQPDNIVFSHEVMKRDRCLYLEALWCPGGPIMYSYPLLMQTVYLTNAEEEEKIGYMPMT